jgi:rod shape determining protein RodA
VKIATALSLARIMSTYSFSIARIKDLLRIALLIGLPMILTILQNDTGSGVVMGAFLFVLYREGLNKWLCIPILFVAALFIISFLLTPTTLLILLILLCVLCEAMMNGHWRSRIVYLATIFLIATLLYILWVLHSPDTCSFFSTLLWVSLLSVPVVLAYIYRTRLTNILFMVSLFVGAILFMQASDYLLNSKLRDHQQKRILSYLGVINDPANIDFNVNQSKIAIGSGRFIGKGFLNGTQNKYGFLPEKHTDFIFCTVGEEWGFVGATFILCVMCLLLLKLMQMGERQEETFGRVYCYSVAAILLFHIMVNVGMTIGLVPVMGIPLPFMSYGGSSLLAFTILLFIAIRLDAATNQFSLS